VKKVSVFLNDYQFLVNPSDIQVTRKPKDVEIETARGVIIQYNPDFLEEPISIQISGKAGEEQVKSIGNIYQQYLNDRKPIRYVCNYYLQNWNIRPTQWNHTRSTRYYGLVNYTFNAKVVEVFYDYGRQVKATGQTQAEREVTYTVKAGDTLWLIAQQFYGDGSQWVYIAQYAKNQGKISENGSVTPGTVLYIPMLTSGGGAPKFSTR
jgi:hypothetical protein